MEHHSNLVPWQMTGSAQLRYVPIDGDGRLALDDVDGWSTACTVFAFAHVSNVLGTLNPVAEALARGRARPARSSVVDGAQAVPHIPVDVAALGADFYAWTAPQGLRADRHRHPARPGASASRRRSSRCSAAGT